MILPTKGIESNRALLSIGAEIIELLRHATPVSDLWENFREKTRRENVEKALVTFDWFVLALSMLFAVGVVKFDDLGRLELHHVS
ncbi:hypothetical protein OZX62_07305 [Bifidobacterium sp. ESL0690]|uniref:ABC-three component system middle component 6 n=1 Tax=Bifidobacterium sp. ESL0690 TaxID=2983214 RepID=UPI0023F8DAC3|nr:ABC-three component system middle component 6 [Bifidobacterium sp. ESL0690]WEV46245.1 hypothetical protein OZX62_07305 [Bifidobacterium sp. ESL0690]